jgi:transmembrane sensor
MDKEIKYKELLERWFNENESKEDIHVLYEQLKDENRLLELIAALEDKYDKMPYGNYSGNKASKVVEAILTVYPLEKENAKIFSVRNTHFLYKCSLVAASVILFLSIGIYYWTANKKTKQPSNLVSTAKDIAPGKNGAILMLANGSRIVLDSLGNGVVANQNGVQLKLNNHQLAYDPTGKTVSAIVYNVISTPKGRQFSIVLPDGTKVWLNSASSLRFPTEFDGAERKVELKGEAYFEVAKNAKMPFKLNVNNTAEIEVLGTHFNVNAYENEKKLITTLLEGSVHMYQIAKGVDLPLSKRGVILKPGQQAFVTDSQQVQSEITVVSDADIDKAMAWKNGLFNFEGATIEDVMKQLERWYDVTVKYEGAIPERELQGKLPRNLKLSQVLKILDEMDIKVKLEGRVLIVD